VSTLALISDVLGVALIGMIGTLTSVWIGYRISQNNNATELAKVHAENERLREAHREEDRLARRDVYQRAVANLIAIDAIMVGHLDEAFNRVYGEEYPARLAEVRVSGSTEVAEAMEGLTAIFREMGEVTASRPEMPTLENFRDAYRPRRSEVHEARRVVVEAMRRDLGL
jgi:hypothetical protein